MKPMDLRRLPGYNHLAIQKTEGDTGKIMIRSSLAQTLWWPSSERRGVAEDMPNLLCKLRG